VTTEFSVLIVAGCVADGAGAFGTGVGDDCATAPIAAVRIKTVGRITLVFAKGKEKDLKLLTPKTQKRATRSRNYSNEIADFIMAAPD